MSIFNNYFFHNLTRKYQLVFSSLLSDVEVKRLSDTGDVKSIITVPVIQSSKEKFIQRINGDKEPDYNDDNGDYYENSDRKRVAISLPMIAFEMVDMAYDGQRKIPRNSRVRSPTPVDDNNNRIYTPAPYTLTFEVNIATKTIFEMNQIIEQIIPAFTPDVNITVKGLDGFEFDCPINFNGLFRNDSYDGSFEQRRQVLWTLNFTMKSFYFAPINKKEIILDVSVPLYELPDDLDIDDSELIEEFVANDEDLEGKWTYEQ